VWLLRVVVAFVLFWISFRPRLRIPWPTRRRIIRDVILLHRKAPAVIEAPIPDALATLTLADPSTAPMLFEERRGGGRGERADRGDRQTERNEKLPRDKEHSRDAASRARRGAIPEDGPAIDEIIEMQQEQQRQQKKRYEDQMHLESLVNFVAFNRHEQQRVFLPDVHCKPPPPPPKQPLPDATGDLLDGIKSASLNKAAVERANTEAQMVLRGAIRLGSRGSAVVAALHRQLTELPIGILPATYELMVATCVEDEDLQAASDFLMRMESAGLTPSSELLDRVMELYLAHKRTGTPGSVDSKATSPAVAMPHALLGSGVGGRATGGSVDAVHPEGNMAPTLSPKPHVPLGSTPSLSLSSWGENSSAMEIGTTPASGTTQVGDARSKPQRTQPVAERGAASKQHPPPPPPPPPPQEDRLVGVGAVPPAISSSDFADTASAGAPRSGPPPGADVQRASTNGRPSAKSRSAFYVPEEFAVKKQDGGDELATSMSPDATVFVPGGLLPVDEMGESTASVQHGCAGSWIFMSHETHQDFGCGDDGSGDLLVPYPQHETEMTMSTFLSAQAPAFTPGALAPEVASVMSTGPSSSNLCADALPFIPSCVHPSEHGTFNSCDADGFFDGGWNTDEFSSSGAYIKEDSDDSTDHHGAASKPKARGRGAGGGGGVERPRGGNASGNGQSRHSGGGRKENKDSGGGAPGAGRQPSKKRDARPPPPPPPPHPPEPSPWAVQPSGQPASE